MAKDVDIPRGWEPPYITPHRHDNSKFGRRAARDNCWQQIDGIDVEYLLSRFGSPLFIASERRLRDNVRRVRGAFERHYSPVIHGWSYKTNYISAVCNIVHQEGSWAEVVSAFEYEKARSLGVPGERIIFNGPNKPRAILERAISEGARLHIDHLDELELIERIARERGKVVPVTLRLNFNTGYTDPWSRFGFNLESGQAHSAVTRIKCSSHLRLTGLHSHIGTFILETRAFAEQVRLMCDFMKSIEADGKIVIDTLDIGGGVPSRNALQGIYLPPEQAVPAVEEYGATICAALEASLADRAAPRPTLIIESGRAVVDDAISLATTVVGTKRLADGRAAAVLDAGINTMLTALWYHHPVKLTRPKPGEPVDTVLYGPLCMNIDVMRHTVHLPPLSVGDRLVFNPAGAYNNTQWLQFIEYRPAVVLIHTTGEVSVIREAEGLDDMCRHDRLPPHLRTPV
ncbi:MAG: alanine racemase [Magnetococcales bacterium]|nr:alanine racemase [Magnetococcales bacterium]MBF0322887.1 alanine racemase [Magnetococcales bacterium]